MTYISPLLQRLALQKAFLITLIVLIILAVISINAVFGTDGIIASAKKSEMMNTFSTYKEQIKTFNAEKELEFNSRKRNINIQYPRRK